MSTIKAEDRIKSQQAENEAIITLLEGIARRTYTPDESVVRHSTPPNQISIPTNMDIDQAAKILSEKAIAEAEVKPFVFDFDFRPMDGANAVRNVMLQYFGTTGRGVVGANADLDVYVGYKEKIKVPWGRLAFAPFNGHIDLTTYENARYGTCFRLIIRAAGKYSAAADGFAVLVEKYLAENSIYKGKAFTLSKDRQNGMEQADFLKLTSDSTVVYNREVEGQLEDSIWTIVDLLEFSKQILKVKTNTRTLLHGPYGTGKSECLRTTAKKCVENGRTYILFPTKGTLDDLRTCIAIARQHQPAMIAIEDIDSLMNNNDAKFQAELSNLIDGVETKDDEVMLLMTSNKVTDLPKNMLRRGRIDAMVHVGPLDREALEKMVRGVVGNENLDPKIDFNEIFKHMEGWTPAFIRGTFEDAKRSAGARWARDLKAKGKDPLKTDLELLLTTQDFVRAAIANNEQYTTHMNQSDETKKPTLDDHMKRLVLDVVTGGDVKLVDSDNDAVYVLKQHEQAVIPS